MDTGKLTIIQQPHRRAVTFPRADIRIDAGALWVGNHVFPLKDVWVAQVRNDGQPAQVGRWLWPFAVVATAVTLIFVLHITVFWVFFYPFFFAIRNWRRAYNELKRAVHFALMVDTTYGMVQAYASFNYLYLKIIERAINKAVRDYILESADKTPLT